MNTKKLLAIIVMMLVIIGTAFSTSVYAHTVTLKGSDVTSAPRTYDAYKLFDISGTEGNYSYKITTEAANFFKTYKDKDGKELNLDTEAKAIAYLQSLGSNSEDLLHFAKEYELAGTKVSSIGDKLELANGYYLIHETDSILPTSVNMLLPVVKDQDLTVKAEAVETPNKEVDVNATADAADNSVAVGDEVAFVVTGKAPNTYGYKTYNFDVVDTMTNLTFKKITSITIGDNTTLTENDYTKNVVGKTLTISLGNYLLAHPELVGKVITVKYIATVDESAAETSIASNKVKFNYSTDPSSENGGTPADTDEKEVKLYTYSITVKKVDSAGNPLKEAKFELQDSTGKVVRDVVSTTDGILTFKGLDKGEYKLVEKEAPNGYTIRDYTTIKIIADDAANATLVENGEDEYLTVTKATTAVSSEKTTEDEQLKTTITEYTPFEVELVNSNGKILPSTGGVGTTIFTGVGIVVMAVAVIVFVAYNKRNNK